MPSTDAAKISAPPVDRHRQAALWALGLGGTVKIIQTGDKSDRPVERAADLPPNPFVLTSVQLNRCAGVTDEGLAILDGMTDLRGVHLHQTYVTDAGLKRLSGLVGVTSVTLEGSRISDAGMAQLSGWHSLEYIEVTNVTAKGLAQLDLRFVRKLVFSGNRAGDDLIEQLKTLRDLKDLRFGGVPITDRGAESLAGLDKIETLHLVGAAITNAGLAHLGRMANLKVLNLISTAVSDAGLEQLKGLGQLQSLMLNRTKVTEAGVARLQKALPKCKIDWKE